MDVISYNELNVVYRLNWSLAKETNLVRNLCISWFLLAFIWSCCISDKPVQHCWHENFWCCPALSNQPIWVESFPPLHVMTRADPASKMSYSLNIPKMIYSIQDNFIMKNSLLSHALEDKLLVCCYVLQSELNLPPMEVLLHFWNAACMIIIRRLGLLFYSLFLF
jgi:hypothetical protein